MTGELLNEQSTKLMFSSAILDNGELIPTAPGWMNWPLVGRVVSQHSGAFRTGFSSQAFIIPEEKFIIILLTNVSGGTNFPLVQKIASIYYEELGQLSKRETIADNRLDLTNKHLTLFKNLDSNELSKNSISDKFPKSYLSRGLKAALSSTESIVFLGEDDVSSRDINLFGVSIHTFRYYKLIGSRTLYTTVSLDKNNKVVFIDYPETE
ncbi:hypothetical protein [Ekhidna sp.]|uniref:hypothetical protein n=1 Tax=Ekhidna sp. TaxID=2608089 RepID=UPI0032992CEE